MVILNSFLSDLPIQNAMTFKAISWHVSSKNSIKVLSYECEILLSTIKEKKTDKSRREVLPLYQTSRKIQTQAKDWKITNDSCFSSRKDVKRHTSPDAILKIVTGRKSVFFKPTKILKFNSLERVMRDDKKYVTEPEGVLE